MDAPRKRKVGMDGLAADQGTFLREGGFTYIGLLILIAAMGVFLAAVGEVWYMSMKREREQELLFIGHQFRNALTMYYNSAGPGARYPATLEDLLKDPRYPNTRRYLRKIFSDPMTNSTDWGLVKGANGEIVGIYSQSTGEPAKTGNFTIADQAFEGKKKYSEWVFMVAASSVIAPTMAREQGAVMPVQPLMNPNDIRWKHMSQ